MRRRTFITLVGGAAATSSIACPPAAHAQQPAAKPPLGLSLPPTLLTRADDVIE